MNDKKKIITDNLSTDIQNRKRNKIQQLDSQAKPLLEYIAQNETEVKHCQHCKYIFTTTDSCSLVLWFNEKTSLKHLSDPLKQREKSDLLF